MTGFRATFAMMEAITHPSALGPGCSGGQNHGTQ